MVLLLQFHRLLSTQSLSQRQGPHGWNATDETGSEGSTAAPSGGAKSMRRRLGHRSAECAVICLYRLVKPTEVAKALGMPNRCSSTAGARELRTLRASRSTHDRRQCARCCRVNGPLALGVARAATGATVSVTVWVRSNVIHARRDGPWLQSPHRIG